MPVTLDTFRSVAQNGGSQQVLLDKPDPDKAVEVKTRGTFASWVVNLFRGDKVLTEQKAVANSFLQALQSSMSQSSQSAALPERLQNDYSSAMQSAVDAVRRQLANQLAGTRALTADNIQVAIKFFNEIQQETLSSLQAEASQTVPLEVPQGVSTESVAQPATPELPNEQAPVRSDQAYRPLHDVRIALSAHAETRRELNDLGLVGRPALALFDEHQALSRGMTVDVHPEKRAMQSSILLANLSKLEHRLDDILARGTLSEAQTDQVARLFERIQSEKSLIGAVMANKLDTATVNVTWSQALSLRRLGMDLSEGVVHDRPLDTQTMKKLGSGAMNSVYLVNDDQGRRFVYKPGSNYENRLRADVVVMAQNKGADLNASDGQTIEGVDLRYEARNIVASRLDKLFATDLIVGARIGEIPVENFTFKFNKHMDEDINQRGDLHNDQGLLMDLVSGKTGIELEGTENLDKALASRDLKRDLSNLVLMDAILGSFDRHPGNYLLDIENGQYKGLKGIDNDFSLFATSLDAGSFRRLNQDQEDILIKGVPRSLLDANLAGRIAFTPAKTFKKALEDLDTKPLDPNPNLTPELRAQLAVAIDKYDAAKARILAADKNTDLKTSPLISEAWAEFASDARPIIPDGHPFWAFVESSSTILKAFKEQKVAKDALMQELASEGVNPKLNTWNVGLPNIADKTLADNIRDPGFAATLAANIRPLLTERETAGTLDRLKTVQSHLDKLEQEGRLVTNWSSDHRANNGQSIDQIVAETGHSYWEVLKDRHDHAIKVNNGQFTS